MKHTMGCPACGDPDAWHGVITEPGEPSRWACDECGHSQSTEPTSAEILSAWEITSRPSYQGRPEDLTGRQLAAFIEALSFKADLVGVAFDTQVALRRERLQRVFALCSRLVSEEADPFDIDGLTADDIATAAAVLELARQLPDEH